MLESMLRSKRVYIFSGSKLDLKEVRFLPARNFGAGLAAGILLTSAVVLIAILFTDWLGLGSSRVAQLSHENEQLREEIGVLTGRMRTVERAMDKLHIRGNELRLLADLRSIDSDTREASVGGSSLGRTNVILSGEASRVLTDAQTLIDKLMREVKLQQASYDEIARRVDRNRQFFQRLPAIKPMAGYYSVNGFGMRVHPVLGVYRMHAGVDIINDDGTKIYASGDGTVRFSGRTQGGYGIVVEIDHGSGYTTLYAHLSSVRVRPGQSVKRGELIALSGRSGLVSGPHLHYEVRRNGAMQNPVDYFFDDVDAARYRVLAANASR